MDDCDGIQKHKKHFCSYCLKEIYEKNLFQKNNSNIDIELRKKINARLSKRSENRLPASLVDDLRNVSGKHWMRRAEDWDQRILGETNVQQWTDIASTYISPHAKEINVPYPSTQTKSRELQ